MLVVVGACWRDPPATVVSNTPPRPDKPLPTVAEFGVFDDPRGVPIPQSTQTFRATNIIYLHEGTAFGWRARVHCPAAKDEDVGVQPPNMVPVKRSRLEYREVMVLPAPGDWGDLLAQQGRATADGVAAATQISSDGKTATTIDEATCIDGWIVHSWTISAHDPPGPWRIAVDIKGYATINFRASFVATHATAPPPPPPPPPSP